MIDIVDQLRAEASYHYSSLFGDAVNEIQMLRKALRDIAAVTFCPKCQGKKEMTTDMIKEVADVLAGLPIRDNSNPGGELDQLRLREAARAVLAHLLHLPASPVTNGERENG